jgi:hypothetical protein
MSSGSIPMETKPWKCFRKEKMMVMIIPPWEQDLGGFFKWHEDKFMKIL